MLTAVKPRNPETQKCTKCDWWKPCCKRECVDNQPAVEMQIMNPLPIHYCVRKWQAAEVAETRVESVHLVENGEETYKKGKGKETNQKGYPPEETRKNERPQTPFSDKMSSSVKELMTAPKRIYLHTSQCLSHTHCLAEPTLGKLYNIF